MVPDVRLQSDSRTGSDAARTHVNPRPCRWSPWWKFSRKTLAISGVFGKVLLGVHEHEVRGEARWVFGRDGESFEPFNLALFDMHSVRST